ncbi:hypothetical protein [Rudanella lutea]|uniref:TapB family protein n=1 Tax=Rudanella lutea TaxID=451374 RepID=UPI0003605725|nr:hypothetical protein [Rudanella lutea]
MKKIHALLILLLLTTAVRAQECTGYFAFQKGLKLELTSFDKKDKPAAILKYQIVDYKPVNGGVSLVFANETYDPSGKLLAKGESFGKCVSGNYFTDVRNISSDMIPKAANLRMDVTGDQLAYPANLNVGDKLKDASVTVKSSLESGMTLMTLTANIVDRQVVGMETIDTPAGKFDCVKITYTLNMRLMGNRTLKGTEYLARGIGVVKSEQVNEKGQKQSSLVLTKLEK